MPAFVHWLAVNPVRWLIPATFLSCVVGIPLMLWWERRRPSKPVRRPYVAEAWRGLPAVVQAAHDRAVLDAAEAAALRIVRDEDARVAHLYVPPSSVSAD